MLLSNCCQFSSCCCASCHASFVFPSISPLPGFSRFGCSSAWPAFLFHFPAAPLRFLPLQTIRRSPCDLPPEQQLLLTHVATCWAEELSAKTGEKESTGEVGGEGPIVHQGRGYIGGKKRKKGGSEDGRWTVWWRVAGESSVGRGDAERCLKRQSRWLKQKVKWKKGGGSMNEGGQGVLRMRWAIRAVLQEVSGNAASGRGRNSERRINTCPQTCKHAARKGFKLIKCVGWANWARRDLPTRPWKGGGGGGGGGTCDEEAEGAGGRR